MKLIRRALLLFCQFCSACLTGQPSVDSIQKSYIEQTINFLASDKMKGRVNYTKEQLKAAEFIRDEFASFGLKPFPGANDFYLPFQTSINRRKTIGQLKWNGQKLADSFYYFFPRRLFTEKLTLTDFVLLEVTPPFADALIVQQWENKEPTLLWVNSPDTAGITEMISKLKIPGGMPQADILLVIQPDRPAEMSFAGIAANMESTLYNIVGMLPGKSKPEEAIIFSAHYDHIDQGTNGETGRVFNGANDNASGSTAVLALAKYFAMKNDNERTILFCLFAGEELGLLGSRAFVSGVNTANIKAVINIEMIGTTNAAGKNAFMVTGATYSSLYNIMRKNLKGAKFKVKALSNDPTRLFMRSDNYPFYLAGIAAHTIMCSDDSEACYHRSCDDVENLDIDNMVRVIRAIALSASTLIAGTDTPKNH